MKNIKKILAISTMVLAIGATSISAFAAPNNPGVPAKDGTGRGAGKGTGYCGYCVYDGLGLGQGGTGRGLGIGGMKLQDGSCYVLE